MELQKRYKLKLLIGYMEHIDILQSLRRFPSQDDLFVMAWAYWLCGGCAREASRTMIFNEGDRKFRISVPTFLRYWRNMDFPIHTKSTVRADGLFSNALPPEFVEGIIAAYDTYRGDYRAAEGDLVVQDSKRNNYHPSRTAISNSWKKAGLPVGRAYRPRLELTLA